MWRIVTHLCFWPFLKLLICGFGWRAEKTYNCLIATCQAFDGKPCREVYSSRQLIELGGKQVISFVYISEDFYRFKKNYISVSSPFTAHSNLSGHL